MGGKTSADGIRIPSALRRPARGTGRLDRAPSGDHAPGDDDHCDDQEYPRDARQSLDYAAEAEEGENEHHDAEHENEVHGSLRDCGYSKSTSRRPPQFAIAMPYREMRGAALISRSCGGYVSGMPFLPISHVPLGSQDLLADDVRLLRRIQAAWYALAEARGYEEVIPP